MTSMNAVREFQRLNKRKEKDLIACPKCDCHWFQQVEVSQHPIDHYVTLGQKVPTSRGDAPFYVLKCIRCGDLNHPRVVADSRDLARGEYDAFLDEIEGKGDVRKQLSGDIDEPKGDPKGIHSEEV